MGQIMRAEIIGRFEVALISTRFERWMYDPQREQRWSVVVTVLRPAGRRTVLLRTVDTTDYEHALMLYEHNRRERAIVTAEEVLDLKPINLRSPRV